MPKWGANEVAHDPDRAPVHGCGKYRFHLPEGETIELDSTRMPGAKLDFNEPVAIALGG